MVTDGGMNPDVREVVRERYGKIARDMEAEGCCSPRSSCCSSGEKAGGLSLKLGYSPEELQSLPEGADLGLGCGAPLREARVEEGMTVLDLGSGAGIDVFMVGRLVGKNGRAIGVDMTPEMISRARKGAREGDLKNVEFRLGEIENLPVADASVDVVISNCVVNLSPDKARVFLEVFRVLRPGGRMVISDVVARFELPDEVRQNPELYSGCMAGAQIPEVVEGLMKSAGFQEIKIDLREESRSFIASWAPGSNMADCVVSAVISGQRPSEVH